MKAILPTIAILALAGAGLQAQSTDLRGGFLLGFSSPTGNLRNDGIAGTNRTDAYNIGAHVDFNMDGHNQIRPHFTYTYMPGSDIQFSDWYGPGNYWGWDVQNKYKIYQLGADWVYNFDNFENGFYTVLGLSITKIQNDWSFYNFDLNNPWNTWSTWPYSGTASQTKPAWRLGVGVNFSPGLAVECTYNMMNTDANPFWYTYLYPGDGFNFSSANWLQVSAVLRFGGQ